MPWSDFGLGLDDDERRRAMRQAIMDAGIEIMKRAPTEGFGAFSSAAPTFFGGYRDHMFEADERRKKAEQDELDEQYQRERMQSLDEAQEDRRLRREDRDDAGEAQLTERETRRSALQSIADPKVRGELELRIGQSNFWEVYDRKTAPAKEDDEAPKTLNFPDGSLRAWDPETRDYSKVLGRKPPKEDDDEGGLLDPATRQRLKGGLAASEGARKEALKRADDEIAEIQKDNKDRAKSNATAREGGKVALTAVPDRLALARKYEAEELPAARYRLGMPSPAAGGSRSPQAPRPAPAAEEGKGKPPIASQAPAQRSGDPAKAPAAATKEQAVQLAALIEKRVGALGLSPTDAMARKAQILTRARKALADGIPPDQILQELQ